MDVINNFHVDLRVVGILNIVMTSVVFYVTRIPFENVIGRFLTAKFGVSDEKKERPEHVPALEQMYRFKTRTPDQEQVREAAKKAEVTEGQVRQWFKSRRNWDRPTQGQKFRETVWRFMVYLVLFAFAVKTYRDAPWAGEPRLCWVGYPGNQEQPPFVEAYYVIEGGFYLSLIFSLSTDTKRKDFKEQALHHLISVFLIVTSYWVECTRIGSLIMALHDLTDFLLEFAKVCKYADYSKAADFFLATFMVSFLYTRWYLYPKTILYTTYNLPSMVPIFSGYYECLTCCYLLQLLHVYWGCLLLRAASQVVLKGGHVEDVRSDTE